MRFNQCVRLVRGYSAVRLAAPCVALLTLFASVGALAACGGQAAGEGGLTTASGLQYLELKKGDGLAPKAGQVVLVHYRGTLVDGTEFDSSYNRGTPFKFTLGVGQVIAGWDEGIALMKVGGKAKLTIPPNLAYGSREIAGVIPANSTLVFEVELIGVE